MSVITTDVMTSTLLDIGIRPRGFRLPADAHVGRVRLQVSDLARSIAYYTGVLGLSVVAQETQVVSLGLKDGRILVDLHERRGIRPVPRRGLLGLYHFAILLPDRAALGRLVSHLASVDA